ncbi:LysR family transcriptional regulator [Glaciimonas sp. PAMC28666]|uniref:LysR family transcriptional regulator n=1 Tax=Glaciimonas sp. PAMC28666 TaxID=2807626 RepID=UPI0019623192|nr:LysR family transcriptional regulator [Glaciimonas sp. PAMC28666]QRX81754.1 LysR family transcriptional regulator [Glaciimonas sp. PAMC28666]
MDILDIDLNLLRVLHAITEEGSLTLAGNRLGLSQPAVSYALGRLRTLFNDPLFVRTGNAMLPTSTALELRAPVRRVMSAAQEALRHAERFIPAQSTRTFHLALSDIGEMVFLPPVCEKLHMAAPGIRLEVVQLPQPQIEEALRNGRLDAAIGNIPTLKTSTRYAPLFHEAYVCMTSKRPGVTKQKLLLDEYVAFSHVFVASTEHSHRMIEDFLRQQKIHRKIALQIPHFSAVPGILKSTGWALTLPRRAAEYFNGSGNFSLFELPVTVPEVEVTLHWHENFEESDANRWFRQLLMEVLAE